MSADLRTSLRDLVRDEATDVQPAEVARAAWRTGRRRRRLRQVGVAAVALLVLAGGLLAVPLVRQGDSVSPAGEPRSAGVQGYPERIGHQFWVRDLPAAPGPMAMLIQRVQHRDTYDEPAGWEAVSQSGVRWRIPDLFYGNDGYPSLSPDGRYLAYLAGLHGPYVIHDLVSGRVIAFPAIGSAYGNAHRPYQVQMQAPAFWSPDGRQLAVYGGRWGTSQRVLVLGLDGTVTPAQGKGYLAGWSAAGTLVWLAPTSYGGRSPAPVDVRFTDAHGSVERVVRLSRPLVPETLGQWAGAVSPGGGQIAVTPDRADFSLGLLRFSLSTGHELGRLVLGVDAWHVCPTAWSDAEPVVPILDNNDVYPAELAGGDVRRVVAIEPRLGPSCVVWAQDALDGTRDHMLFGTSMAGWTWWWRETLIGLVLGVSLIWFTRRWIVVRRRRAVRSNC